MVHRSGITGAHLRVARVVAVRVVTCVLIVSWLVHHYRVLLPVLWMVNHVISVTLEV